MMATIAAATLGSRTVGHDRQILHAALAAAGAPELEAEITATGRGASIHHAIASSADLPTRDFATWICLEKKCSRVRMNTEAFVIVFSVLPFVCGTTGTFFQVFFQVFFKCV